MVFVVLDWWAGGFASGGLSVVCGFWDCFGRVFLVVCL